MNDLYDWKESLIKVQSLALEEQYDKASQLALEILLHAANNDGEGKGNAASTSNNSDTVDIPKEIIKELSKFYIHSLFHVVDGGDQDSVNTALEYIRKKKQKTSKDVDDDNYYQYSAEEAYCYYRLKRYDKAQQTCERALRVQWKDEDTVVPALDRSNPEFLALAHVYAQTLYRIQKPKASIGIYQKILQPTQQQQSQRSIKNNRQDEEEEDDEELLANMVAVYCSIDPNNTIRPTGEEILMDIYDVSKKISTIMDLKYNKKTSLSSLGDSDSCVDLAFNIATLLAIHSNHFQDTELAASILLQTQQMIKANYANEDNSINNNNAFLGELAPMQCNYAYALLRQCNSTAADDPNYQQKRRLAEAFWNKVVATSADPTAATVVSKHNLSILKATATTTTNMKKKEEKKIATMEDHNLIELTPDAYKLLLPAQLFTFLRNKAILCLLSRQKKDYEDTLQELRKAFRMNCRSTYGADVLVLEHGLQQLKEHLNNHSDTTNISMSKVEKSLEEAKRKDPNDIYTIASLLLLQAQLSLDNNNLAGAIQYMEQLYDNGGIKNLPAATATLIALYKEKEDDKDNKDKMDALLEDLFKATQDFSACVSTTNTRQLAYIKSKADYLFKMGNSKEAAQIYEFLITRLEDKLDDEQLSSYYHSCVASLIQAIIDDDPQRAQELGALLPDDPFHNADNIDPEELEDRELPRFQRARTQVLISATTANSSNINEDAKMMKKSKAMEHRLRQRAKKREAYLAKLASEGKYNPLKPTVPDPERWLPKSQRSSSHNRRGRGKQHYYSTSSQGVVSSEKDVAKLDAAARAAAKKQQIGISSATPSTAHISVSSSSSGNIRRGTKKRR